MNKASELFDKVIVNNTKIDINELEANNGKYHVGQANSNIKVEFVLRNKKEIPAQLFKNLDNIKSVKLPETIESIGEGAFEGSSLTYINIPQTVSYIGAGAFEGVSNLPSDVVEKISYIMHKDDEYYSAEDALTYNSCLPGAVHAGDVQTPAVKAQEAIEAQNAVYSFESFNNEEKEVKYGEGTVEVTELREDGATVKVVTNESTDPNAENFVGQEFNVNSLDEDATLQLFSKSGLAQPIWVTVTKVSDAVKAQEAVEAQEAVLYTKETAAAYNAQLPGAVKAGDPKPKAL